MPDPFRDARRPPFCYQTHEALDTLRESFDGPRRVTALAVYLVLTEAANRAGGEDGRGGFTEERAALADAAGVSSDTLDRYVRELVACGLLVVERNKAGKVNLPNTWVLTDGSGAGGGRTGAATPSRTGAASGPEEEKSEEKKTPPTPLKGDGGTGLERVTGPPPAIKVDGRDLPFDAMLEICGVDPKSPRVATIAVALNGNKARGSTRAAKVGIRDLYWTECERYAADDPVRLAQLRALHAAPERFQEMLAVRIRQKARKIREAEPWRTHLTPNVIRELWLDVDHVQEGARGLTGDAIRSGAV